jgi:guanylate kinase
MSYAEDFDVIVVNDDLEVSKKEIERLVENFIEN